MITAVADRSKVKLEHCLGFSRLNSGSCDAFILGIALQAIKEMADHICQNEFLVEDEDGEPVLTDEEDETSTTERPIDSVVELWIMRKFAKIVQFRMSGNNIMTVSDLGSITPDPADWKELTPARKIF